MLHSFSPNSTLKFGLIRARANEALRRGIELLQVDATEDSRPILESFGLTCVGKTTPYRHG